MNTDWTGQSQAKQKWHEWRGKGLGSSDAPVLLGVSPWKNLYQLWIEKTGQEKEESKFKGNWATNRGNELEPMVRDWYNTTQLTKMVVDQGECKENLVWRASFDGVDHELERLIEIKCPSAKDHYEAVNGRVPEKYIPQVQWLLMVSGYDTLDYVSYNDKEDPKLHFVIVRVKADKEFQDNLKRLAIDFWSMVETRTPPIDLKAGQELIEDKNLSDLLKEYNKIIVNMADLESIKEGLLDQIKPLVKTNNARCDNFTLQWIERKGNVKYADIPQLAGVDTEQYRAPTTRFFKIGVKK